MVIGFMVILFTVFVVGAKSVARCMIFVFVVRVFEIIHL